MQTATNINTNINPNLLSPPRPYPNQPTTNNFTTQHQGVTQIPASTFAGQFVNAQSQAGLATVKRVPGSQVNQISQQRVVPGVAVVGQQVQKLTTQQSSGQVPPKPTSTSRIEYVPYDKKVVEYETRQIVSTMWVPVQRKCLNYYAIQHITEYIPREVDDVRYEMVPEQHVQYRLQYVPVEKQIVHLPSDQANYIHDQQVYYTNQNFVGASGVNLVQQQQNVGVSGVVTNTQQQIIGQQVSQVSQVNQANLGNTVSLGTPQLGQSNNTFYVGGYQPLANATNFNVPGYQALPSRGLTKSNFVTSDGYVPSYNSPLPFQTQNQPSFLREHEAASGITSNLKQVSRDGSVGLNSKTKQNQNNLDSYYSPARNWDRNAF